MTRSVGRLAGDLGSALPAGTAARAAIVVGAAGIAVGAGGLGLDQAHRAQAAEPVVHTSRAIDAQAQALLASRANQVLSEQRSRSADRAAIAAVQRTTKSAALSTNGQAVGGAMTKSVMPTTPKAIAMSMLGSFGWDSSQFSCLDSLWTRESNWNPYAHNSSSGAYGIPQALPGSKMGTIASDWATDAATQIKWGLTYIRSSYGSPCGAWGHSEAYGWY